MTRISTEYWALAIVAATGTLLFGALLMEHYMLMEPCPLCLMQRIWFALAGLCAYAGLLQEPRYGIYPLGTLACAITGGGFAIRQLWLQSLPADQVPACGPGVTFMFENWSLGQALAAMTRGTGDCAIVDTFLGVSLPLWALAGFVAIAAAAIMQWRSGSS
jgi:disulfide bond formation protein DsbB